MSIFLYPDHNGVANSPVILDQNGLAMILPSSGSMAANGALTLTTALPVIYSACYLYFPAGAVYAGSVAGMYYTVMSSTTAGVVYNNIYTSGHAAIPANPTAIVAAGPGAYTQTTATDIVVTSSTVPGNSLGDSGFLFVFPVLSYPNNVNAKTFALIWNGQDVLRVAPTTTTAASYAIRCANRGDVAKQIAQGGGTFGAGTTAHNYLTVNTALDSTLNRVLKLAVATDYIVLESSYCQVNYIN